MLRLLPQADLLPEPRNYFQGIRKEWSCSVDNAVLFLRRTKSALQRKTFESNQHHRFVLLINLETKGVVSVDRTYLSLAPRQAMLIFPYQFHHYLNIPTEGIRWLFFTFETDNPKTLEEFRFQVMPVRKEALDLIEQILRLERSAPTFLRSNLITNEFASLLAVLRNLLVKQRSAASLLNAGGTKPVGMKILTTVNHCLGQRERTSHTIAVIARKAAISESRLRFLFRQHFGLSLGSYIRNYQIHRALACMQNPSTALYEVAAACGYSSLAVFSRAFKHQTGLSPAAFRKCYF